jgi:hypothetical protein
MLHNDDDAQPFAFKRLHCQTSLCLWVVYVEFIKITELLCVVTDRNIVTVEVVEAEWCV